MASTKRAAAGDETAPPPTRLRVAAAAPDGSNTEPPPRKNLVKATLATEAPVKRRSTGSTRIGRLGPELWQLRHDLGQVRDTVLHEIGQLRYDFEQVHTLLCKQDGVNKLILSKLDNMNGTSPSHYNHEHLTRQGKNLEGTCAEVDEGSAEAETKGKDTSFRLRFLNKMKSPVFHEDEIKSIRIGIFDGDKIIESGLLSKLKIEVLALEGNFPYSAEGSWTSKEFTEHIAYGRDGKGHVLEGKGTTAQLINGKCHLDSIRFREGSCRTGSRKFIVAARIRGGQAICDRVQEAVMDPVTVQDRRNKYNQKSYPPKLDDGVQCLENISTKYRERLENQNIRTVEQFLKARYKDANSLCSSLELKPQHKRWGDMVTHAETCCLKDKPELKSYRCEEKNVVLFFNYVHCLVGARFGSHYITSGNFKTAEKNLVDTLKKNAYDQLDGLPWDYEMRDNIPVPIGMNTEGCAGPSCTTISAQQPVNSGHHIAQHQVGGTPASEGLRPCAPPEPSSENAYGPNFIHDPSSTHNYQAGNASMLSVIGGVPTVEGSIHVLNESSIAIANYGPSLSFSVPGHLLTQNYEDQGTGFAAQDQHNPVFDGISPLGAQAIPFGVTGVSGITGMRHIVREAGNNNYEAPRLHQGEMQYPAGYVYGSLQASASAHISSHHGSFQGSAEPDASFFAE